MRYGFAFEARMQEAIADCDWLHQDYKRNAHADSIATMFEGRGRNTCRLEQNQALWCGTRKTILRKAMARLSKSWAARNKLIAALINTYQTTCNPWKLIKEYTFDSEVILSIEWTTFGVKSRICNDIAAPTDVFIPQMKTDSEEDECTFFKKPSSNLTTRHIASTSLSARFTAPSSTLLELRLRSSSSLSFHAWPSIAGMKRSGTL